jgi:outer membrane protein TolC
MRQQRQQYEISQLNLQVTRDGRLPDLNLSASYGLSGTGGDLYERSGGLGAPPVLVEEAGYSDAVSSMFARDTPSFSVGHQFSYPLGMRTANAGYERAAIQLRQSEIAIRNQELSVATEVTNAGLAVENTFLQLEAARRSREAAERSADAEIARFQVGASTNYQVVQAQNSLTSALLSELRATINYTNAIAEFYRVQRVGR